MGKEKAFIKGCQITPRIFRRVRDLIRELCGHTGSSLWKHLVNTTWHCGIQSWVPETLPALTPRNRTPLPPRLLRGSSSVMPVMSSCALTCGSLMGRAQTMCQNPSPRGSMVMVRLVGFHVGRAEDKKSIQKTVYHHKRQCRMQPYSLLVEVQENVHTCAKLRQSRPTLCNAMDDGHQAPLSMGFSTQEYWSGLPCPSPGELPSPGIKPTSLTSPTLAGGFFTTSAAWETPRRMYFKANQSQPRERRMCSLNASHNN